MVAWRNIEKETLEPANLTAAHDVLSGLRDRVAGMESAPPPDGRTADGRTADGRAGASMLSTGVAEIDRALPWSGLPPAGLHEIAGWRETDFALSLIAGLLARDGETRPVIWCQPEEGTRERGRLYGPGLAVRGLDPSRLIFVNGRREKETLWAMEEALASGAAAGAVGEIPALGMTETRRLQLAAAKGGSMGLVLRGPIGDRAASAALSRWRAEPVETALRGMGRLAHSAAQASPKGPSHFVTADTAVIHPTQRGFSLSLWRARGGQPGNWTVQQDAETLHLALAAPLAGRTARAG
jgi:protein ImuA